MTTRQTARDRDREERMRAQSLQNLSFHESSDDLNRTIRHNSQNQTPFNSNDFINQEQLLGTLSNQLSNQVDTHISNLENRLFGRLNDFITQFTNSVSTSVQNQNVQTSQQNVGAGDAPTAQPTQGSGTVPNSDLRELVQLLRQPNNTRREPERKLDLYKWNVIFSGDGQGLRIDEFIKRVEHISVTQNHDLDSVANNIYVLLKGLASKWYFQWVTLHPFPSWSVLKSALEDQFRSPDSEYDIEHELMSRVQKPNESFDTFFYALLDINSKLRRPKAQSDIIEIAKRNINCKMLLFVHNYSSNSVADFLKICRNAERNLAKIEASNSRLLFNKPRISEIEILEENFMPDNTCENSVDALYKPKVITCFDCKQEGHLAINCTQKSNRIFCYRCGKDNFTISTCPNCKKN